MGSGVLIIALGLGLMILAYSDQLSPMLQILKRDYADDSVPSQPEQKGSSNKDGTDKSNGSGGPTENRRAISEDSKMKIITGVTAFRIPAVGPRAVDTDTSPPTPYKSAGGRSG